jgi:aminocarboxymuconate-semialdehyde decarboxylase
MTIYRTIDVHNHYYPWEYLQYLASRSGKRVRAEQTGPHSYVVRAGETIVAHIDRAGHYDLEARLRDLDSAGMETQVMSQTVPGPELLEPKEGVYWTKKINDAYAAAARDYPGRYFTYASLPYQDPDAACKELERCYKDLGIKGVMMFSNCDGLPMFDRKFDPIFSLIAEYELPVLMHPTVPLTASVMDLVRIPYQLYAYTLDTTLAVISLIFHGVFERHKKLRMIHAHLGGMAPYLVRRLKDSWKGYAKEWGLSLNSDPEQTYRERIWLDTCSFYLPAMRCAIEWVGLEHVMIGTDYAHRVGDPEGAIKSILDLAKVMNLTTEQRDLLLGKNAEKFFGLPPMPKDARRSGSMKASAVNA